MRYWRVPLDAHQVKIPQGEIHLIVNRCKGCEFCVEFCPRDVLVMSDAYNVKGYHYPEVAHPENCVECDLCEVICPDFAIFCLPSDNGSGAAEDAAKQGDGSAATRNRSGDHDESSDEEAAEASAPAAAIETKEVGHGDR